MKHNDIIFFDFETTGPDPLTAQPVQIASVVIDGLDLVIKPDSIFQSLIKPEFDLEYCERFNLAPLTEDSIRVHKKTKEMLENAPSLKTVWGQWCEYIQFYNYGKGKYDRPIAAGKNIYRFDLPICSRIAGQEPYKLGPWDKDRHELSLFQPRDMIDIEHDILRWFKYKKDQGSYSMDNMKPLLGIPPEDSHDALKDVLDGAFMMCKFLNLYKRFSNEVSFKDSFVKTGANIEIRKMMNEYHRRK